MPLLKTPAIVGSAFDLGEKDLVVHLLTPEHGRLGVVIRGGKAGAKGRAAVFQPLAEIELTAYLREGKDLATLREASEVDGHAGLRADLNRLALASFLLDLALAVALPGQEDIDPTFDLLRRALGHLERAPESPPLTALCHWLLRFLALHGVEPAIDEPLLTGAWRGGGKAGGRKPRRYLLHIAEGLIAAAPGEPGGRLPAAANQEEGNTNRRAATVGPRAWELPPAAVRAVYENARRETDSLVELPAIPPAAATALLRALIALAIHHLDVRPKSLRFLEQSLLK